MTSSAFGLGRAARYRRAAGFIACLGLAALPAHAAELDQLRERLDAQEQQLRVLTRELELREQASKPPQPSSAEAKAAVTGFSIQSSDNANRLRLRGELHAQARWYADDSVPQSADTLLLRRVRPSIEGTLGNIFDFRFTPDFGGGSTIILDAYLTARLQPWAALTVGKFKPPVGLERLQSNADVRFAERGLPSSLVPNRDIGVQLGGNVANVQYAVGYFNGVADGGRSDAFGDSESDTSGDWAARIFAEPFRNVEAAALRGFGIGIGASYGKTEGSPATTLLPGYRTPGQQTFFRYRSGAAPTYADGDRVRLAPQAYYYIGSLGLLSEYVRVEQDVTRIDGAARSASLEHSAWQIAASWFLTGEQARYKGFKPNSTFAPGNPGIGAWELVARYHTIDIDDAAFSAGTNSFADPASAASTARATGIGVNWYLNEAVKWMLNYEHTRFDGGAPNGADRDDEDAVFAQFAVSF